MKNDRKIWTQEEDEAIMGLVRKYGSKKWSSISERLRQRFPDEGRSGKQCRQRWHNHLSPLVSKEPWGEDQLRKIFEAHQTFGNKWTEIAQILPGRTDNAVKNQFYSTLRKGLRRICKVLGNRNSTTRIKKIKPSALSTLLSNINQIQLEDSENESQLYDILFEYSKGQKFEGREKSVSQAEKQKLELLLQSILDSRDLVKKKRSKLDNCVKCKKSKQQNFTIEKQMEFEPLQFMQRQAFSDIIPEEKDSESRFYPQLGPLTLKKQYSNLSHFNDPELIKKKSSSGSKSLMKKMSFYEEIENLGHEDNNNFNIFINNSPKSEAEQINYLSVTPRQPTPSGWESAQNIFNSQPTDIKFSTQEFDKIVEENKKRIWDNQRSRRQ